MIIGDSRTLAKAQDGRVAGNLGLLEADADAEYAEVIEINMDDIVEPVNVRRMIRRCRTLSDVASGKVDEVFIGSCMTNISRGW